VHLEVTDAASHAINSVKQLNGSLSVKYRTPLLMRYHMQPHKFKQWKELKTPMPTPKKLKQMEKLREKGLDVEYPSAPWYTENLDKHARDAEEKERRIANASFAGLLPEYPAPRTPTLHKTRVEKKDLHVPFKLPN
jgi:hypothetical protein